MIRRWRRPKGRPPRTGALIPLPSNWASICQRIRDRDLQRCRFCGQVTGPVAQVNHCIPRRLADPAWVHAPENLVLLCVEHHAEFTHGPEADLLWGKPYAWRRWLAVVKRTGLVPSAAQIGDAMEALKKRLEPVDRALAEYVKSKEIVRRR